MRSLYNTWNLASDRFCKNDVKKKPSWQELVNMVEQATKEIKSEQTTKEIRMSGHFLFCNNFYLYYFFFNWSHLLIG